MDLKDILPKRILPGDYKSWPKFWSGFQFRLISILTLVNMKHVGARLRFG